MSTSQLGAALFPRYEKLPLDYRAPFLLTLEPPGPLPLVSGRSASSSLASLSRYLYHRRWLWSVPSGLAPTLPLSAIAQLLSVLTEYVSKPAGQLSEGRERTCVGPGFGQHLRQTVPISKRHCQYRGRAVALPLRTPQLC